MNDSALCIKGCDQAIRILLQKTVRSVSLFNQTFVIRLGEDCWKHADSLRSLPLMNL